MATIVETSQISPPPPTNSQESEEVIIPLTFLDIIWTIFQHPIRRLLFYKQPSSSSSSIVSKLKESLSLTLKHYFPVTGNLLYPLKNADEETSSASNKPFLRYKTGDSIPFTVAESDEDFDELVRNHPRDADRFYAFIPNMPLPLEEEEEEASYYKTIPLMAIQVTLFPGRGLCIGFSNHHCLGDGNSITKFIKAWASISKLGGGDDNSSSSSSSPLLLPLFDRSLVKDPLGIVDIFWEAIKKRPLTSQLSSFPLPTKRLRATFVLNQSHIKKMKQFVLAKKPYLSHVSSFAVAASYTWTCFVKSNEASDEEDADELFGFAVDVRPRVDPPIPDNYFGNCLGHGKAMLKRGDLIGEEGFVLAVESISEDIKNRISDKDKVLRGAENWMSEWSKFLVMSILSVSGSPKFDLYEVDFGFGKAEKVEVLSIDGEKYSMSMCKSRDCDGGIEIGFSLPEERLKAFGAMFEDELKKMIDDDA